MAGLIFNIYVLNSGVGLCCGRYRKQLVLSVPVCVMCWTDMSVPVGL